MLNPKQKKHIFLSQFVAIKGLFQLSKKIGTCPFCFTQPGRGAGSRSAFFCFRSILLFVFVWLVVKNYCN